MKFLSQFEKLCRFQLPAYSGTRIMMMPLVLGDLSTIPTFLSHYTGLLEHLFGICGHQGEVAYITIDEKIVRPSQSHRRAGLHVDGVYNGGPGSWGGGIWGTNGLYTIASHAGCKAWNQEFSGKPEDEGECDHMRSQCIEERSELFEPNRIYWMSGMCVHESLRFTQTVQRQFVRLSMPSDAPWFEGYTENPLGTLPTGKILPRREFMNA